MSEYLHDAEEESHFKYRKGYWDGHMRTKNLIMTVVSMGEETDAEFAQKEMERVMGPMRSIILGIDHKVDTSEVEDRVSRVLKEAGRTS